MTSICKSDVYSIKPGYQKQEEKKNSLLQKALCFLNTRIPSIVPYLYVENNRDVTVNVTTKENLDFLYRSAMRYEFRFFASGNYLLPLIFYVDLKTPQHKYSFMLEVSMFPTRKPYVSALRNVRFTDEKHAALVWET